MFFSGTGCYLHECVSSVIMHGAILLGVVVFIYRYKICL